MIRFIIEIESFCSVKHVISSARLNDEVGQEVEKQTLIILTIVLNKA